MTDRQIQLLHSEVQRHVSLAMASREPAIHRGHMEVAEALSAAITESEDKPCRNQTTLRRLWRWATRTVFTPQPLPGRPRPESDRRLTR